MEEQKKDTEKTKPRGKYDDKLKVKGTFLDLMKVVAKDANDKTAKPKEVVKKKAPK